MATLIILVVLYLAFWPVDLHPVAWTPPAAPPMAGRYQPNMYLSSTRTIWAGRGPEAIAFDTDGLLYTGLLDGRIMRLEPPVALAEEFAKIPGGRPLGLAFDAAGDLIVADAVRGLLRVSADGQSTTVLADTFEGRPLSVVNDVTIAADGRVYFTDSSSERPLSEFVLSLLEHRGDGRLFAYDPATGSVTLLLDGLEFANGVVISPDERFLLVTETGAYRVQRYWLEGPKKGISEVVLDNLPGFPDNIRSNGRGRYWLALAAPRNSMTDRMHPHPWLKKVAARLPAWLLPEPDRHGIVVAITIDGADPDGRATVIESLQDPTGSCARLSCATEYEGKLYLGTYELNSIHVVPLAPTEP